MDDDDDCDDNVVDDEDDDCDERWQGDRKQLHSVLSTSNPNRIILIGGLAIILVV